MWWEVDHSKIGPGKKWVRYAKGGDFRRYYGNILHVVDWSDKAREFYKNNKTSNLIEERYWYREGITYTSLSSKGGSFRYLPPECIFDIKGPSIISLGNVLYYALAFFNSSVANEYLNTLNPTITLQVKDVKNTPLIIDESEFDNVSKLCEECVELSRQEWMERETSFEFVQNSIVNRGILIESVINSHVDISKERHVDLTTREKEIEKIFDTIYNMDVGAIEAVDFYISDVITIIRELLSYSIGCMFGRYSLDYLGLQFAGGDFKLQEQRFMPDPDNIIPINDNEYFSDDIVSRFVEFIRIAFGDEHLEENLKFIANNLGIKGRGTSREIIRRYFLNDFYKDHLKMYSNLPIYWLFDSGKENGFKALIYMHRYDENLIAKMRQDYLLPMYRRYNEMFESEKDPVERSKLEKKINELSTYDLAMELYSTEKVSIDLDDGVKVNYAKFQNIDNPGGKGKINLLYKLK